MNHDLSKESVVDWWRGRCQDFVCDLETLGEGPWAFVIEALAVKSILQKFDQEKAQQTQEEVFAWAERPIAKNLTAADNTMHGILSRNDQGAQLSSRNADPGHLMTDNYMTHLCADGTASFSRNAMETDAAKSQETQKTSLGSTAPAKKVGAVGPSWMRRPQSFWRMRL